MSLKLSWLSTMSGRKATNPKSIASFSKEMGSVNMGPTVNSNTVKSKSQSFKEAIANNGITMARAPQVTHAPTRNRIYPIVLFTLEVNERATEKQKAKENKRG